MLSGRKSLKRFGPGQRLMIWQKTADLMTFTAQNKVILSLGFQCVVWSKHVCFGEILIKDMPQNVYIRDDAVLLFFLICTVLPRIGSDSIYLNQVSTIQIYSQSDTWRNIMGTFQVIAIK